MASETESLALRLVRAVYNATDGRPMQWRMVQSLVIAAGLSRQRLACQPSPGLGQANAVVPIIDEKPPMIDSMLYSHMHPSPADRLPPLHGPPVGELVEFPA